MRVIVAVIAVIIGGGGVLAYLTAWAIIPEEGDHTSVADNRLSKNQDA